MNSIVNEVKTTHKTVNERSKNRSLHLRTRVIQLARHLVCQQLKMIQVGQLTITDSQGSLLFGDRSEHCDLKTELIVEEDSFYIDILTGGSIGAAEAYVDNKWTTPDLTQLIRLMVINREVVDKMEGGFAFLTKPFLKLFHLFNRNTGEGSKRNIIAHYDLGNEFFKLFLDEQMMYSSAVFPSAMSTLEEASLNKLDLVCQKLQLRSDDHLLEIGTGWGGLAVYAAQHYGCHVTTTTISENQYQMALQRVSELGLESRITILKKDYRQLTGSFDKIVSIEMIEAVGWQYYGEFYKQCSTLLKQDGLMLLQAITIEEHRYEYARKNVDFIQRYIFPGSCIPSITALSAAAAKKSDLRIVELEDFAEHYALTLAHWRKRFIAAYDEVVRLGYSDAFIRLWEFYLSYCEGGFSERSIGLCHILYAKPRYRGDQIPLLEGA